MYSTVYSRRRSKKTSKLRVTGLCEGNSPVTGEFPAQGASNASNVSIWWRHHVMEHIWICHQNMGHLVEASVCYNNSTVHPYVSFTVHSEEYWCLVKTKQFSRRLSVYIIYLYRSSYYENRELSRCQLFRHWWRRSLSLRQPTRSQRSQNLHHGHVYIIYLTLAMIWPNVASMNFAGWPNHIFAKRYIAIVFFILTKNGVLFCTILWAQPPESNWPWWSWYETGVNYNITT